MGVADKEGINDAHRVVRATMEVYRKQVWVPRERPAGSGHERT